MILLLTAILFILAIFTALALILVQYHQSLED